MTQTEFHPAKLGIFVFVGLMLAFLAFMLWGPLTGLWQNRYIIFFKETATGLDAGSLVRLNGVTIGKVDSINLYMDPMDLDPTKTNVVTAVVVQMDPAKVTSVSKGGKSFDSMLKSKRISATLGLASFVSFTLEVDLKVESHPLNTNEYTLWNKFDYARYFGNYDYIPARQSTIDKVMEKLRDVLDNQSIPNLIGSISSLVDTNNTNGLLSKSSRAMDSFNRLAGTLEETLVNNTNDLRMAVSNFAKLSTTAGPKLDTLVSNLNTAAVRAQVNLDKFGDGIGFITNSLPGILTNLTALSAELTVVARGAAPLPPQALETLRSAQDTIESIQRLIEYVERHPESLLRGRAQEK